MSDSDTTTLGSSSLPASRRTEIISDKKACLTATRTMDLHRLYELARSSFLAICDVSNIRQLLFEKRHLTLKRVLRLSNKDDSHLKAIINAAMDDWRARLTMRAHDSLERNRAALLNCYRPQLSKLRAVHVLCPRLQFLHEFQASKNFLLYSRLSSTATEQWWTFTAPSKSQKIKFGWGYFSARTILKFLLLAFRGIFLESDVTLANSLKSEWANGLSGCALTQREVLGKQTFYANTPKGHQTLVLQRLVSERF